MFKTTFILLIIRSSKTIINLLINIIIGRMFGVAGIAHFNTVFAWQEFFSGLASGGLNTYVIRSVFEEKKENKSSLNILSIFIFLLLIGLLLYGFFELFKFQIMAVVPGDVIDSLIFENGGTKNIFLYLITISIAYSVLQLTTNVLRAALYPILSSIIENIISPLMLLLITFYYFVFSLDIPQYSSILFYYLCSIIFAMVIGLIFCIVFKKAVSFQNLQISDLKVFINKSVLIFRIYDLSNGLNGLLPFIILPFYCSSLEIGYFSISLKFVLISNLILSSLSGYFNPIFVRLYADKEFKKLFNLLNKSRLVLTGYFLFYVFIIIIFGEQILSLFGDDFVHSKNYLKILMIGQAISSSTGLSGQLLNMIGLEKYVMNLTFLSMLILFVLSIILCPFYKVYGLIIAMILSNLIRNFSFFYKAKKTIITH
jgi:O-antigen/teichoic acid export membrane protein